MLSWKQAAHAPKDGTVIIGSFRDTHPDKIVCMWNARDEEWIAAYPQEDLVDGLEDRYFENERFHSDDLEQWAEL